MPRWQRGHATGCRPVDGSSNIKVHSPPLSTLPSHVRKEILPRGSKLLFMLSGGIDSAVAAKFASEKFEIFPVHFVLTEYFPLDYVEIMQNTFKLVMERIGAKEFYLVDFQEVFSKIVKKVNRKYRCIVCRKAMLGICDMLCERFNFDAIGTGESLAQKASQTAYNYVATHKGLKHAVIAPLLGMEKEEIVRLAKKHGLYQERHVGSCLLAPRYPVTRAKPGRVERIFRELEMEREVKEIAENVVRTRNPEREIEKF